jgi:energy-coupling factor transporter ATP-binding protein EcfA2
MITVESVTRNFGAFTAVDDVGFTAEAGRVTGFLGPDGAGKSTTMRILVGLTRPTSGSGTISGRRYVDLPNPGLEVGVLLDASAQHAGLSGEPVGADKPEYLPEDPPTSDHHWSATQSRVLAPYRPKTELVGPGISAPSVAAIPSRSAVIRASNSRSTPKHHGGHLRSPAVTLGGPFSPERQRPHAWLHLPCATHRRCIERGAVRTATVVILTAHLVEFAPALSLHDRRDGRG